jgi:uncharacterized protein YqgC (DUF456 family)
MSNVVPFPAKAERFVSGGRGAFVVGVIVGGFLSLPTVGLLIWLIWRHVP